MKGKSFCFVMIASLLASMALVGTAYGWGYTPGDDTKINIKFEDCTGCPECTPQFANCTPPTPYDIGDKFNITIEIQNADHVTAYGITIMWNSTFCQHTGNRWMSPAMRTELLAGRWGTALLESWSNDTLFPAISDVGTFIGYGQTALSPNSLTGTYDLVTIEFQIMDYGPSDLYIFKDWGPLETQYAVYGWTASGWLNATTPMGQSEPYDVLWAKPIYENVTNAELFIVPEFLAYLLVPLFLISTIIAVVLAKTARSKRPRGRVDAK